MTTRNLLRGGCVLTLGPKTQNMKQGDVLIEDGTIADVGASVRARDAEVVDATDTIVMPGFVDSHRYAWMSLFRTSATSPRCRPKCSASITGPRTSTRPPLIALLGAIEAGITIAGRVMKRQGELLHVDWPAVKRMVAESRDHVLARSGFKLPSI